MYNLNFIALLTLFVALLSHVPWNHCDSMVPMVHAMILPQKHIVFEKTNYEIGDLNPDFNKAPEWRLYKYFAIELGEVTVLDAVQFKVAVNYIPNPGIVPLNPESKLKDPLPNTIEAYLPNEGPFFFALMDADIWEIVDSGRWNQKSGMQSFICELPSIARFPLRDALKWEFKFKLDYVALQARMFKVQSERLIPVIMKCDSSTNSPIEFSVAIEYQNPNNLNHLSVALHSQYVAAVILFILWALFLITWALVLIVSTPCLPWIQRLLSILKVDRYVFKRSNYEGKDRNVSSRFPLLYMRQTKLLDHEHSQSSHTSKGNLNSRRKVAINRNFQPIIVPTDADEIDDSNLPQDPTFCRLGRKIIKPNSLQYGRWVSSIIPILCILGIFRYILEVYILVEVRQSGVFTDGQEIWINQMENAVSILFSLLVLWISIGPQPFRQLILSQELFCIGFIFIILITLKIASGFCLHSEFCYTLNGMSIVLHVLFNFITLSLMDSSKAKLGTLSIQSTWRFLREQCHSLSFRVQILQVAFIVYIGAPFVQIFADFALLTWRSFWFTKIIYNALQLAVIVIITFTFKPFFNPRSTENNAYSTEEMIPLTNQD